MFFCSLFLKGTTNRQTGIRGKSIIVFLNSKHERKSSFFFADDVEKNRRALKDGTKK